MSESMSELLGGAVMFGYIFGGLLGSLKFQMLIILSFTMLTQTTQLIKSRERKDKKERPRGAMLNT